MDDEINIDAPAHISLDEKLTSIASNPFLELSAERAYTSEGLSRVSQHSLAAFGESAFSAGPGSSEGISAHRVKGNGNGNGNGSPSDPKSPGVMGMNFVKGFSGVQKKITRDGQPAKRRGPKPDSKPAQTRRQELNRQAQRTHRERKEQYIKALEIELARLREGYTSDVASMNSSLEQHKVALREHQEENAILKDMLANRGIAFQAELETRKAAVASNVRENSFGSGTVMQQPGFYGSTTPTPSSASGYSPQPPIPDRSYNAGRMGSVSGGSGTSSTQHSYSPADPGVFEQGIIKRESMGVPEMAGGIFEADPHLQVEFILALEATCREHGEFLLRRSLNSADEPDEAQYSGHALMATCPPPNHISSVPARQGGLEPTYPHQVPQIPAANLNTLLNLSNRIKAEGLVEGGQVTPIMALQSLRTHHRYYSLNRNDVVGMIETIKNKVRCYGFGAVMEDFELRDALSSIFATKFETYEQAFGGMDAGDVEDY